MFRILILEIGICLGFGCWDLEFLSIVRITFAQFLE